MSEKINIEGHLYEFAIMLVTEDGEGAVPINKSSVKYLEIEDNLANIGLKGKIIISNFYGLLQKLNIYNVNSESPNIAIRFKNLDFQQAGASVIPEVYVLAALGKSTETSTNVVDRHVAFEFEERSIVRLKRNFINTPLVTISEGKTPEKTISEIFAKYCPEIKQSNEDIIQSSSETIPSIIIRQGDSAYDVVIKSYDHLAYDPAYGEFKSPGLVQIENIEGKLERKLVIKSLAADITAFLKIAKEGGSKDAKKYLNDKFSVAFSNKSDVVLRDNIITKYDIMRVDYEEVFEKKWSNISKVSGDQDSSLITHYNYSELRSAFENLFTDPYSSNLPHRDDNTIKILKYNYPGAVSGATSTAWATNKTLKSFVYDNIAVVFKVKGQPYRVPGKFIRINTDSPTMAKKAVSSSKSSCADTSTDESKDADTLNGWWYVISVQHVFENDIYFNKIVAVKLYVPVPLVKPTSYGLIGSGGGVLGGTGSSSGVGGGSGGGRTSTDTSDRDGDGIPNVFDARPDSYDVPDDGSMGGTYPGSPFLPEGDGLLPPWTSEEQAALEQKQAQENSRNNSDFQEPENNSNSTPNQPFFENNQSPSQPKVDIPFTPAEQPRKDPLG